MLMPDVFQVFSPKLPEDVFGSFLEIPRSGRLPGEVVFEGWVLARDPLAQVILVLRGKKGEISSGLSQQRTDVIRKFFQGNASTHPRVRCGFKLEVVMEGTPLELHIQVNGRSHLWKKIMPRPAAIDRAKAIWDAYSRDDLRTLSDEDARFLEALTPEMVQWWNKNAPKVYRDSAVARAVENFTSREAPHFRAFLKQVSSPDLCVSLVRTAVELGECRVCSPFADGQAVCRESFCLENGYNILRFVCDSQETFFVVQRYTSGDGVFFPCRNIFLFLRPCDTFSISNALRELSRSFSERVHHARSRLSRVFLGVQASHARPYHFFYDKVLGMHLLARQGILERLPGIVMRSGEDFFSFKMLYGLSCGERVMDSRAINEEADLRGGFFIQVGAGARRQDPKLLEETDPLIVRTALEQQDPATREETDAARRCFPLVWFGISSEKRAWVELADAAVNIFLELVKQYPRLGIVLDGWTFPFTPGKEGRKESLADHALAQKIRERLPLSIPIFNIIGSNPVRKIVFANKVDAFISNYSTGSMFVSRFAGKPGVTHLSNEMYQAHHMDHRHARSEKVPCDKVRDIRNLENPLCDTTSYSIDWQVVYDMLLGAIRKFCVPRDREA